MKITVSTMNVPGRAFHGANDRVYTERLHDAVEMLLSNSVDIAAIQEFFPAKKNGEIGYYYSQLQALLRGQYHIIFPPSFDIWNDFRQAIPILLVKKELCPDHNSIRTIVLNELEPIRNRYVYVDISLPDKDRTELRILHVHIPQVSHFRHTPDSPYVLDRIKKRELMVETIKSVAQENKGFKNFLLVGDLNMDLESDTSELKKPLAECGLRTLVGSEKPTFIRYDEEAKKTIKSTIDHICIHEDLADKAHVDVDSSPIIRGVSDHSYVQAEIACC